MNDQDQATKAYWDAYKKAASEESGGGGGLISNARVETGFKVFAGGVGQDESWFPALYTDKAARATAKKAAKQLADEHGCNFSWGLAIVTPKDKTYKGGELATWSVETMVRFKPSYDEGHDIVLKSLMEHGVFADGKPVWLRLGFQDSPWHVENDKKDSQGRTPQVAYVTEKFANPGVAKKAIADMPKGDDNGDGSPPNHSASDWADYHDAIVEALTQPPGKGQSVKSVAEDYEVDSSYIQAIADEIVPV